MDFEVNEINKNDFKEKAGKAKEVLWSRYFILMMLYSLTSSIAVYLVATAVPLYAIHMGGSKSIAGLLMGVFMFSAVLGRPFFGKLLDEKSRRFVLIGGALLCTTVYVSYALVSSVFILILLRVLNGIGFSANTNASGTVVADIIPKSRMAEGVGFYGISNTLATAIGPGLTLFFIKYYNYHVLFLVTAGMGFLSILFAFCIDYEKKGKFKVNIAPKKENVKSSFTTYFEKRAVSAAVVLFFLSVTIGSIMTFIPLYAASKGISDIGGFFIVYAFALLITRLFAGRLADKYGAGKIIIPGMLAIVFAFFILAMAISKPMFLIGAFIYGVGFGCAQPTLNAVMIKRCPMERKGAGNSTFFMASDLGSGIGAVLWGFISQMFGYTWIYVCCILFAGISLGIYIMLTKKKLL